LYATEDLGAVGHLLMNGRQLPTAFRIIGVQRQPLGSDIHTPGRIKAEGNPLAMLGAVIHATAASGLQALGALDDPTAVLLGDQQFRKHGGPGWATSSNSSCSCGVGCSSRSCSSPQGRTTQRPSAPR